MKDITPQYLTSIHHDGSKRYVRTNQPDVGFGDEVAIRLRSSTSSNLERVLLRTCPDGEQAFFEMRRSNINSNPAYSWWEVKLRINMPVTAYRFLIFTSDGAWWYNGSGLHLGVPTDVEDFRILAEYEAPTWVRDSVFYQIFPDRFADGDGTTNVRDGEISYRGHQSRAREWGVPQSGWPEAMVEFYGGDLKGVEQNLDYLIDLGVNAIYLNPIFTALSNHRYDVTDYENVDPHLGGNQALIDLRKATASRGMRFILDIVPNHCGVEHPWFKAAKQDPSTPTAEYFTFHHHPDDYECWLGVRGLPKLNYRSQRLREVVYAGKESIFRHWLNEPYSIDGWRVDVANMLARHGKDQLESEVWAGIRQAVKEENPNAYLLGENFFDGTTQLQGNMLDAVMNYSGFSKPLLYWLGRFEINQGGDPRLVKSSVPWPTEALVETWQTYRATIPWVIACQQFNLLGSHDTARVLNILGGDPARNRLAVAILLTYIGVPCIYYGDEIGMRGKDSLEARNCMLWDKNEWDASLRSFYQTMIHLRRTSPALIDGGFQVLLSQAEVLVYMRDAEEEQIIVVANRSPSERIKCSVDVANGGIPNGTIFEELFTRQKQTIENGILAIEVHAVGVQVWKSV